MSSEPMTEERLKEIEAKIAKIDRIDARLRYVADKTDFRLTCELSAEERALLAERVALLYEKATIVKTGRPASWVEPKPEGT